MTGETAMSERALEFVELWVSEHVAPASDPSQAKALAAECLRAANAEGISRVEIDEAFDDLAGFIAGEITEAHARDAKTPTSEEELAETVEREAQDLRVDDEIASADEREGQDPTSPNK
jgi:membrane-bound lytic murein transglycosylase B